jgi:hypothetical protein
MSKGVVKMRDSFVARTYDNLFRHDEWNVGIVREPISTFLRSDTKPVIHWLPPPAEGTFLADPFAILKDRVLYIFCEEFNYKSQKGRIVSLEISNEEVSALTPAIELPSHISYPYLVEDNGQVYCVPESALAGEIALYRAETFPTNWKRVARLVRFPGVDNTIFRYHDYWWLMSAESTLVTHDYPWYRLFVWYAKDLRGPWLPHSANPVKRGKISSRPAGTPFMHDGSLYRPTQDLSRTYGGRVVINRMLRLTPSEFDEENEAVVEPNKRDPYPDGLHTISACGNMTVVDGKRVRFVKSVFKRRLLMDIRKSWRYAKTRRWE